MKENQGNLAQAVEATVRGYIDGWTGGNPHSEKQARKMEDLKSDVAQAVDAIIRAAASPVENCPGEYRHFALEIYAALLIDVGNLFVDAGREAKAAAHHINDIAMSMIQEAARQGGGNNIMDNQ